MARGFGSTLGAGSSDKITTALTAHAIQRSYALWALRNGDGGLGLSRLFEKRTAGAQVELYFYAASGGSTISYQRAWSGGTTQWAHSAPATGAWHHLGLSYDASSATNDATMYLDGVVQSLVIDTNASGTLTNNTDPYVIGNRGNDNARTWDGLLAEFGIWDRILTPSEFAALAAGVSPALFPQSLVSYEPMVRDNVNRMIVSSTISGTSVHPHPRVIYAAWPQVVGLDPTVAGHPTRRRWGGVKHLPSGIFQAGRGW